MWWLASAAFAVIPAKEDPRELEIGAGAFFDAGGEFMTQPTDNKDGATTLLPFNGFAGFSPGGGIGIDFRYKGIVGLEFDIVRRSQVGKSEFTINGVDFPWQIQQPATQLPLLLKLSAPVGLVHPNLFGGIEPVIAGDSTVVQPAWPQGFGAPDISAEAGSWLYVTFGIGFEFCLPIEDLDFRIPFNIRLSDNPSLPKSAFDRAEYVIDDGQLSRIAYVSEWQYQASITLGVWYFFM
jgi:hypothetical protein